VVRHSGSHASHQHRNVCRRTRRPRRSCGTRCLHTNRRGLATTTYEETVSPVQNRRSTHATATFGMDLRRSRRRSPHPNHGVQLTPLARLVGLARFTRQSATACWRLDNAQPPATSGVLALLALHTSAARTLPGSCLSPTSSTLHTLTSGAADAESLGGFPTPSGSAADAGQSD